MTIARLDDDDDDITVDDEGVDNDAGDIFDHFEAHQGDHPDFHPNVLYLLNRDSMMIREGCTNENPEKVWSFAKPEQKNYPHFFC